MFLAINQQVQHTAYHIKRLDLRVYTYEGFCTTLYQHYESMIEELRKGNYLDWMCNALGLKDLVLSIEELTRGGGSVLQVIELLLGQTPVTSNLPLGPIQTYYQTLLTLPTHLQFKAHGDRAIEEGDLRKGLGWYKKAQRLHYDGDVENNMGVVYMLLSEYDQAIKAFDHSIHGSDGYKKRLNRLKAFIKTEAFDRALEELNHLRSLYEGYEVWICYGDVYEGLNRIEEALAAYQKAYEVQQRDEVVYKVVPLALNTHNKTTIELWLKREQFSQKMLYYIEAKMVQSVDPSTYCLMMERVLDEDPGDQHILMELSRYYRDRRQIIKALEYMNRLPHEHQVEDEVLFQKALIAKSASNTLEYQQIMDQITKKWKDNVRKNTIG